MTANWFAAPSPVTRRVRTYFAPVNRAGQTPVLFDPAEQGNFSLDAPPPPWIDLGWIQGFTRKPYSKTSPVLTGIPGAALEQVRETLEAQVALEFLSWTKLTMALATGSQHMNLLAPASGATASADGAQAIRAVTVQAGSTPTAVMLAASDAAQFKPGSMIALDTDYAGANRLCGLAGLGRICSAAPYRRGLYPTRHFQRGARISSYLRRTYPGRAITRRRPAGRIQATSCNWICRQRRRVFLPGVVSPLRVARQPGRTHLLPLPPAASHDRSDGSSNTARCKSKGWARASAAQRPVSGAARHRSAGRRECALLSEFSARTERVDLVSVCFSPNSCLTRHCT